MFRYARLLKSNKFDIFRTLTKKLQYIVHGCIFIKISDQFTCVHLGKENSQKINLTNFFICPTKIIFILVEETNYCSLFCFLFDKNPLSGSRVIVLLRIFSNFTASIFRGGFRG